MKILFISQYFPPEMGAPAARVYETCRQWVRLGEDVTVITAFPNHPTGVIPERYRGRLLKIGQVDGIRVIRTALYAAPNKGVIKRSLCYFSFMISAIIASFLWVRKQDVVIATSPQLLVGLSGYVVSRLKQAPFIFEVRDLWPEAIEAVGISLGKFLYSILDRLACFFYRKAAKIIVISNAYKEHIAAKGFEKSKLAVIRNGADLELFTPDAKPSALIKRLGIEKKFIVTYTGTIGLSHALETILDSAEILKEKGDTDIIFLLVGEGAEKERLMQEAEVRGLDNVIFIDKQPREEIPGILAASAIGVVLVRKGEIFKKVIPTKIFEVMAAAKPIILGMEGETREIVQQADAGICIEPESAEELTKAILKLKEEPATRNELRRSGRVFATEHCDRKKLASRYLLILRTLSQSF